VRRHPIRNGIGLEVAWLVFALTNLLAMLALTEAGGPHGWETVPFHFIYVSFTILYGYRMWQTRGVVIGILFVSLSAGGLTLLAIHHGREDWAEITEVPLMSLMFLAMVFHVRRRQRAVATSERLSRQLRLALARQRAFVSDASHELLTPITIARGHLDLLRREQQTRGEIAEACDVVTGELDRMTRLIERLLLIEAAPSPGFLRTELTPASSLMAELFHRWREAAPRRWLLGPVPDGSVAIDRDRMILALDALLENAVRHTREGDEIEMRAEHVDGEFAFAVRDTGEGIPNDALEHVFDRFYRVDKARNRRFGGAGLGLSIVRAVAEAHGGRASVTSAVGCGSTFRLEIPCASADQEPVPAAADRLDGDRGLQLTS
jgi:signal transduction histidine kinase